MKVKRLFRVLFTGLAITVALLVIAGIVYERIGRRNDRQRFAQVGKSFDIGGRTLNIYCSGSGGPTVILEGGYSWVNVQSEIAKFTRACWYERAGQGWSDPGPSQHTASAVARDLHDLLQVAAIPPPYVLVGASFGGFPVRVFAGKYPDEVAGIVLVDSAHEDQQEPPSMKAPVNKLPSVVRSALCVLLPTAGEVGIVRLMSGGGGPTSRGMTPDQAAYSQFLSNQPKSVVASGDEGCNWERTAAEVRAAGNLGDRPLIVLTAGQAFVPDNPTEAQEASAFHDLWMHRLQPQLAQLSSRGRQVIVEKSGHGIQFEAPEAVIGAVHEVVTQLHEQQQK